VARYLDPTRAWTRADDVRLRALTRTSQEAALVYNRRVARHRVMTGGSAAVPSGFEIGRMAGAVAAPAHAAGWTRWFFWIVPAAAVALALVMALTRGPTAPSEYIGARGLPSMGIEPRAGVGVGAVTEDGREYEAIFSHAVHLDDWLRLSFTNERPELRHLFVFALQPERAAAERLVWIAPTPDEGRSLDIAVARFHPLPFEVRLASRHVVGRVAYVALFTEAPLTVDTVRAALDPSLDPSMTATLPSALEPLLRARLPLSPRDVVQVLETHVVTGSAASELDGPSKEAP